MQSSEHTKEGTRSWQRRSWLALAGLAPSSATALALAASSGPAPKRSSRRWPLDTEHPFGLCLLLSLPRSLVRRASAIIGQLAVGAATAIIVRGPISSGRPSSHTRRNRPAKSSHPTRCAVAN